MTARMLPIDDAELRAQLVRRATAGAHPALVDEILDELDREPVRVRRPAARSRGFRLSWPRLAFGGVGALALVLVLAATLGPWVVGPANHGGGAGYPLDRPLTTGELGRVLAGGQLSLWTTIVVQASIDPPGQDAACSTAADGSAGYEELGRLSGIEPPVCVVGLSARARSSGTFAFRVLGPQLLGYLADVAPAASRLAYGVTDEWPASGYFLVDGWLGGTELLASCAVAPARPDLLAPFASNCPFRDWLSDRPGNEPPPSAREVNAQGYYVFKDPAVSVAVYPRPTAPVRSVYLVRAPLADCDPAGGNPCQSYDVVASVDAVSVPAPLAARILTTGELTRVMAGPALAPNTTFLARATISAQPDACPMDRYRTLGVIAGAGREICVMAGGIVPEARFSNRSLEGVFAFRYLAPGHLGYLGEITVATADGPAFHVGALGPMDGSAFVVDGWLGSVSPPSNVMVDCAYGPPDAVDPLAPYGVECPDRDWLSSAANPPADWSVSNPTNESYVWAEAAGARAISRLALHGPAVHGLFVVRWETEGCDAPSPGQALQQACRVWRVLAKVDNVAVPSTIAEPSASASSPPSATPAAPILAQPLSDADFLTALAAGRLTEGTTVAVKAHVAANDGRCPDTGRYLLGYLDGIDPRACVYDSTSYDASIPFLVLRSLGGNRFSLVAQVQPGPAAFVYGAADAWPHGAFLVRGVRTTDTACDQPLPAPSICGLGLSESPSASPRPVAIARDLALPARDAEPHLYVVAYEPADGSWRLLAQLSDLTAPSTRATTAPGSSATPLPTSAPTASPDIAPAGLIGPGNRPLTADELIARVVADPDHLEGRTAIATGPFPTMLACPAASPPATQGPCNRAGPEQGDARAWVVQMSGGTFKPLGPVAVPGGSVVSSLTAVRAAGATTESYFVVDASIDGAGMDACDLPNTTCDEAARLTAGTPAVTLDVQDGAYHRFADPVSAIRPTPGLFVIRMPASTGCTSMWTPAHLCEAEVVARLEAPAS